MESQATASDTPGRALVGVVRRRWGALLLGILAGALLAYAYTSTVQPVYESRTSVLVTPTLTIDAADPVNGQGGRESVNLDNEARLVTSTRTLQSAADLLGVTPEAVADSVTTDVPMNTTVLEISYAAASPVEARDGARAVAQAYLDNRGRTAQDAVDAQIAAVQEQVGEIRSQLDVATARAQAAPAQSAEQVIAQAEADVLAGQLTTLSATLGDLRGASVSPGQVIVDAAAPSRPAGPSGPVVLAAGVLAGVVLGAGLAVLRERTDRRVRDGADVERLVNLSSVRIASGQRTVPLPEIGSAGTHIAPEFYRLCNTLVSSMAPGQRVVEVVGAGRDDGSAGRVAGNLAAALAAGGHSVTLLSLDPVDPVRPRGVPPVDLGAAELLSGDLPWDDAVLRTPEIPRLQYLGPGEATDGLSTALQSDAAAKLLSSLSESVDFLLVVPSPATANPDAQSVARLCDAVLVTVEIGRTPADDLVDAIGQFRQVGMEEVMCILVPPQRPSRGRGARRAAAGPDTHEVTATGDGNPEPGGNPEAGPGAGASSDRP